MADLLARLVFVAGMLGGALFGTIVAFRPWQLIRTMARLVYAPFRAQLQDSYLLPRPMLTLLLDKESLADASPDERWAWEARTGYFRLIGLSMIAICVGLLLTIIVGSIVKVV